MLRTRRKSSGNSELTRLRARLAEAEETLDAIRTGEVDAITVEGPHGRQIFTLQSADLPYRTLVERMSEGAASMNAEGVILFCNQRLAEMVGMPPEKLIGRSVFALSAPAEKETFEQLLACGLQDEARGEVQFRSETGAVVPVQASLKAIPGEQGASMCLIASNLTDRRLAEQAVHASRQRLESVLNTLPVMVCLLTREHDVAFANREFQKQFGECAGRKCYECRFQRSEPCEFCESFRVLQTNTPHDWEFTTPDGHRIHAFDSPFTDADGAQLILKMDVDVTEQKRAEEALQKTSQYARNLIEASLDPLVTISSEGKITDVNRGTELATGLSREQLIGSDFCDYFTEPGKAREGYQKAFEQGVVRDYPLALRHASGRITDVLYNASVYRNEAGEVQGIFAAARDITERIRADEKLREQAALLDLAHDAIILRGMDGRIALWSRGASDTYGYSAEEAVGKISQELLKTAFPMALKEIQQYIGQAREWEGELRHRRKDGAEIVVASRWSLLRDEQGHPAAIMEINRDISVRKKSEQALRAASQYTRNLIEASLDPLVTISSAGKITDVNHATEAATGLSREQLIGSDFCDYFTEPEKAREGYREVFEQGTVRDYPLAMRHTSGRLTYVLYNASVYRNEAGEVQGIFAAARDVTARRAAEEALRAASQYTRNLIEASLDPLVTISSTGKITDVNRGTELATGLSREALIGTDFCDYFTEPEKARQVYQRVFEQGSVRDYPLALRHASGRLIYVLYNAGVYRDPSGQVQGIFAAARDVTARKAAEEALEQKAQELARSNEELAQFAYVASHDLQEPLRKVVAFGDRLAAQSSAALDEQGRDYLERMQNAAKRMSQLIESLLDLSRVTTKGTEFQPVDLNAVLSEVLADLEVRIQQRAGRVDVEPLPTVMADRSQMRQLFQNLIGNALKFHQENVPPVVRVHAQHQDGAWEIHVEDNGIGFEEKYTDRIFRPFQRLHGKNVFEGSGMGLAICNKIAFRHAGQITAHSQPGRGSDFVLTLPATPKAREASAR